MEHLILYVACSILIVIVAIEFDKPLTIIPYTFTAKEKAFKSLKAFLLVNEKIIFNAYYFLLKNQPPWKGSKLVFL
jgi:hypothetical protein